MKDVSLHATPIIGWGVDKNEQGTTNYWIIRNSWGETFGIKGDFHMLRG